MKDAFARTTHVRENHDAHATLVDGFTADTPSEQHRIRVDALIDDGVPTA